MVRGLPNFTGQNKVKYDLILANPRHLYSQPDRKAGENQRRNFRVFKHMSLIDSFETDSDRTSQL